MPDFRKIKFIIFLSFFFGSVFSQVNIDSLVQKFEALPNDTNSIIQIVNYANAKKKISLDVALAAFKVALKKCKAINNQKFLCQTHLLTGSTYSLMSDLPNASFHLAEAKKLAESLNNRKLLLKITLTIGNMYSHSHQIQKAKEIYEKGLKLCGDTPTVDKATILNNIGGLLYKESDLEKEKLQISASYILSAVKILEQLNNEEEIINKYCNLGLLYCDIQKYDSAIIFLNKAKVLIDKHNLPDDLITYYSYMGRVYTDKKDFEAAEKLYLSSIDQSLKLNSPEWVAEGYLSLSDMYDAKGDYKKAVEYFRKFYYLSDSIVNVTNFKAASDIQNKLEREKKEAELNKLKAEQAKNKIFNIALIVISLLLVVSGIMMYSRFKIKSESEKQLKAQNEIIGQKNKDITDSINYSRKIQDAILPSQKTISEIFPENFIFYKPKDIISGDFYWCAKVNSLNFLAVADCTGHGVPGALMSMLGTSLLKEIILTKNITDVGEVLNELRKLVINALDQNSGNRDGMDLALICFDEATKKLHFAGANNSVIIISHKTLSEIKGDKQPIGIYENIKDFNKHTIDIESETLIYLYTDGYADQFGGAKGKKFKYKQLNEMILEISQLPLQIQKETLHRTLEDWRKELEQVDDVCVAGIKISV